MKVRTYESSFYLTYAHDSLSSAREILSIVQNIANPQSVVDVGCGLGTWLKAWIDLGVHEIVGIGGDYVKPQELLIPPDRFFAMDLNEDLKFWRRFDLVESLEVAEHLHASTARKFISFLCSLGDMVLFSAAIPYQGGTNHINEQWPEYWADLFKENGLVAVDVIRDLVWENPRVSYYYAQNALLFVRPSRLKALNLPPDFCEEQFQRPLSRVHPRKWIQKNELPLGLIPAIAMVPRSLAAFSLRAARKVLGPRLRNGS